MDGISTQQWLDMLADRIEYVLASQKVPGKVWGGTMTSHTVSFTITPAVGTKVSKILTLGEEIALALGLSHCRLYREGGAIQLEIRRGASEHVSLLGLCRHLQKAPEASAILGVDKRGEAVLLHIPSPSVVHTLISGTTGSGKTELLRTIVASLAYFNHQRVCQFILMDPKSRGLSPFQNLPHLLKPPIYAIPDAADTLEELALEMERRDRLDISRPYILLVIDELADLLMTGGKEMEANLTRIIQRGRGAGIHIIAATQKPAASVINPLIRSNFPMRIVGKVANPSDAYMAAGIGGTNAEKLLGHGDMLAIYQGQARRFQAGYIPEPDIARLVRWTRRRHRHIPCEADPAPPSASYCRNPTA